jgi:hypothetical protein
MDEKGARVSPLDLLLDVSVDIFLQISTLLREEIPGTRLNPEIKPERLTSSQIEKQGTGSAFFMSNPLKKISLKSSTRYLPQLAPIFRRLADLLARIKREPSNRSTLGEIRREMRSARSQLQRSKQIHQQEVKLLRKKEKNQARTAAFVAKQAWNKRRSRREARSS